MSNPYDHGGRGTKFSLEIHLSSSHHIDCEWQFEQHPWECTCGAREKYTLPVPNGGDGMSRVLICGGRDFTDARKFGLLMQDTNERYGPFAEVIHGGARGADRLAAQWAVAERIPVREFPADWTAHGRAAGPIRNEQMLREGKPDLVVAFEGGRGTANMVALARAAGVRVIEVA